MSTSIRSISTPEAFGPPALSQGMQFGNLVFVSGQVGILPDGIGAPDGLEGEIETAIDGLEAVLRAAGSSLDLVLKTSCYVSDISYLEVFNKIYVRRFHPPFPARTTIQATLAMGLRFEIDAVAVIGS